MFHRYICTVQRASERHGRIWQTVVLAYDAVDADQQCLNHGLQMLAIELT